MARMGWWSPKLWKALWVAVRRSHHDRHARATLLRLTGYLVFVFGWIGFNLIRAYRSNEPNLRRSMTEVLIGLAVLVAIIIGSAAIYKRMMRRVMERKSPAVSAEMKKSLYRESCLVAALLDRLGSESVLEKELPKNVEIVTRRILLDKLNELELREGLEPWLLDLLLAPDGHWTEEQKQKVGGLWETFAMLSWALGLTELRGMTDPPRYTLGDVRALFANNRPEELMVLPSWDMRPARNQARHFFQRCWSDLVARRVVSGTPEEGIAEALAERAEIQAEGYLHDYLIGSKTIPELETPTLLMVMNRAYRRWQTLSVLVAITAGEVEPEGLRDLLARYLAPPEVEETEDQKQPA